VRFRTIFYAAVVSAIAATANAQTTPTGSISGKIVDPDGLVLPSVVVSAASPALQGVRTTMSSANGDYIIPFLPAGDYELTFELAGLSPVRRILHVQVGESVAQVQAEAGSS
jgi:hypothetical protein